MSGLRGNIPGTNTNYSVVSAPLTAGDEKLVNTISTQQAQIKNLTAGANVSFSSDSDSITINAGVVPGNVVNTVQNVASATGVYVIGPGTANDVKLRSVKSGTNTTVSVNGTEDIVIDSATYTTSDAAGITGQSLKSGLSTAYDTYLKSIKAGAGISVSTVGQDIVVSSGASIYNPQNEIYIDSSYTGTESGTASEPFTNLDAAIVYLGTLPLGNYVFIMNQGNYSTAAPWAYPMGNGTTQKSLSMVGKVANGCVITSDINFIGIAGEPANFQINSIACVGASCTMDLTAYGPSDFASISILNGFVNSLDFSSNIGNPSLVGYIRCGVGTLNCLNNGPTLQNSFLIGNINLTTVNSRLYCNSCSNINCTLTLSNGAIANISGLVSTTNTNWLVSSDASLNLFYLDAWTGSLSNLTGDTTLAKCIIDKELIAGTNISLSSNAQGQTTISAAGGTAYTNSQSIYLDNSYTGVISDGGVDTPFKTFDDAMTYINTLTAINQYTLYITSDGTTYTSGSSISWPVAGVQLSAIATSGKVVIANDISFFDYNQQAVCRIENITFSGSNSIDISGSQSTYNIEFVNCKFNNQFQITTNIISTGTLKFTGCTFENGVYVINNGRIYFNNCFILSNMQILGIYAYFNNCVFELAAAITLSNAANVYVSDTQYYSSSLTPSIKAIDATTCNLYLDDQSRAIIPLSAIGVDAPAVLGTTFIITGMVEQSLTAGSGISLTTNPSTGRTSIIANPFVYTPYIDDLGDGYTSTTSLALGFKPGVPTNYDSTNTFISLTEPFGITSAADNNVALGYDALSGLTSGDSNIAISTNALSNLQDGADNLAIGRSTGSQIVSGLSNVLLGNNAGTDLLTNSNTNVCIGTYTGLQGGGSGDTSNCVIIGDSAYGNKGANGQIVIGASVAGCGIANSLTFPSNLASQAGTSRKVLTFSSTTGQIGPIADGTNGQVLTTNGSGSLSWNTPTVYGTVNTVADDATATGNTLKSSTSTASDIKLKTLVAGSNLTITPSGTGDLILAAAGGGATNINSLTDARLDSTNRILNLGFKGTTTGADNLFITPNAQPVNITNTASNNTVIATGIQVLEDITTGILNCVLGGSDSLRNLTSGQGNTAINNALRDCIGNLNTGIGPDSGKFLATGNYNVFCGASSSPPQTFPNTTGSIILGAFSSTGTANNDEQIVIGYNLTGCGITRSLTMAPNLATQAGTANRVMTLSTATGQIGPIADGTNGQVLTTNGSGSLSWTTVSGSSSTLVAYAYMASPENISSGSSNNISASWQVSNTGGKWSTGSPDHVTVQSGGAGVYEITTNFTYTTTSTTNNGSVISRFIINGSPNSANYLEQFIPTSDNNIRTGSITNTWVVSLSTGDVVRGNVYNLGTGVTVQITNWKMTVKFLY